MKPVQDHPARMTKADFLQTWGYLQALKDMLEEKARTAAAKGTEQGASIATDYMQMCAGISELQRKIDTEATAQEAAQGPQEAT